MSTNAKKRNKLIKLIEETLEMVENLVLRTSTITLKKSINGSEIQI